MFVDLRGYTALAQDFPPEELFSLIDRYTRTVARIVRAHGGFATEFNGDGLMAVFGARAKRIGKEQAALGAALSVVDEVAALDVGPARQGSRRLTVGVGIATGRAFVGRIRAADRCVWAAVGTTTNLASRLQALSRDFEASIVIDDATRAAAGFDPGLVSLPGVRIRGLRDPVDVHVLPRERRSEAREAATSSIVSPRWASLGAPVAAGLEGLDGTAPASLPSVPQMPSSQASVRA
jgi:class 3 adenylate cyclase